MSQPLVATLSIAPAAQEYFDDLRMQHFPKERNYLNAHLTLFNALPDEPWVFEAMQIVTAEQAVFEVRADQIISLGGGTAFKTVSPELTLLHRNLQTRYQEILTNQDKQKRNFHITVQNKVDASVAKRLQGELISTFEPFCFTADGVHLWRYLGGPWEFIRTCRFKNC
nr:2'-5' RNA ligase family protein [uncultured Dyadobacter sp.]